MGFRSTAVILLLANLGLQASAEGEPNRLLWGDTHLHTSYSFDAFLSLNQSADPDTAYRWAKGLPVIHPYHRARVQIDTPLDFLVVSDHAEFMGVMRAVNNDTAELEELGWFDEIKRWATIYFLKDAVEKKDSKDIFVRFLPRAPKNPGTNPVNDPANVFPESTFGDTAKTETTAWHEIVDAAERHNQPGKFTSLIGWEWSSIPTGANLHRVVFTPDGADKAKQFLPYGSDQSQYPEDLWAWLQQTKDRTGTRFVSIPHNSNVSKGYMFDTTRLNGKAITADYARTRMTWEPVVEATQLKGDSETHPELSPDDEFADYETYGFYLQQDPEAYKVQAGDYLRSALKRGLAIEQEVGVNPYKFGMIGSTDAHTGLASAEETNFWGKMAHDSIPENKTDGPIAKKNASGWNMAAQGLAAVWAADNTREEIYAAFQRKEVYATTGPRIAVRFFAGWDFEQGAAQAADIAQIGYAQGVPMGGDLLRNSSDANATPQLLIRATKGPKSANLDRVQVIKGWVDSSGEQHEQVFNVAWSGERELDQRGKLVAVGSTVDLSVPSYDNSIGSTELSTVWRDPTFNPEQRAFYYLRVLQIPTPRHSLYDAVALQKDLPADIAKVIQERAYTSPIWYTP